MLGEADLLSGPLEPGERMASMMVPSIALDGNGVALAAGAAGGTRLRSAPPAGRRGNPRRGPRAPGRRRPAAPPPRRLARPPGAGLRPGDDRRARVGRLRGPRVADPPPLFRRRQRRHADWRRGRSSEEAARLESCEARREHPADVPTFRAARVRAHRPAARRFRRKRRRRRGSERSRSWRAPRCFSLMWNRFRNAQRLALSFPLRPGVWLYERLRRPRRSARSGRPRCRTPPRRAGAPRADDEPLPVEVA